MGANASLGEAVLDITGDDAKLQADVDKAGNTALQKMGQFGAKMRNVGLGMTAAITLPIVAGATFATNAASDLVESANAVNVVFGESADIMHEFGQGAAEAVGLAESEFNQLGAVTGSFLTNLGYDQEAAAEETINLTKRASDMASIFNKDVSTALSAIQSGLKGEFNPLEQFGVKMNAAAIEAKALQMGLADTNVDMLKVNEASIKLEKAVQATNEATRRYGADSLQAREAAVAEAKAQEALDAALAGSTAELTDNMKAQAALALIYEQTNKLAGDFQNTSDGLANSTRIMKAQLTDAAASLGQQLLPYVLKAVQFFSQLISKFQGLSPEQQKMILLIGGIAAAIGPVLMIIGSLISAISAIIPVVTAVAGVLTFPLIAIIGAVIAVIALLAAAWANNWGGIREKVAEVIAFLRPLFDQFVKNLVALWQNVLWPALQKVWAWMNSTLFPFLQALGNFLSAVFGLAVRALAGIFQNVLWPAMKKFIEWADTHIMPILRPIAAFFKEQFAKAIDWVTESLKKVTDWLNKMADKLRGLELPDWMTPGSPTPWEIGLWGVNDALKAIGRASLPTLTSSMSMMPAPAVAGSSAFGSRMGGGAVPVQFVYQPFIGVNDEREARNKLRSIVNDINREASKK